MASTAVAVGQDLRRLYDGEAVAGLTDAQLLERVACRGALTEAAFEAIVARHGSAVLACCRRVVEDSAAAEDAFQATFLVLFDRAARIRVKESLAPWLLHVGRLAALKARQSERRRRAREGRVARPEAVMLEDEAADLRILVRAEVDRLPGRYRDPVRLCYFEGRTHDDAAAALGCPVGTVRGRLSRARDLLRTRLARRGIVITPMAVVAALAATGEARAEIRAALREAAVPAAVRGTGTSVGACALAAAVARGLVMAAVFQTAAIIAAGAGLVALAGRAGEPPRQAHPAGAAPAGAAVVDRYGDPLPRGAIARLGTTRFHHDGIFLRVFFAPDGKTLVTAGGKDARLWDVATGRLLRSVEAGWIAAPSPDGRTLFTSEKGILRAIAFADGRDLRQVALETPNRLDVSPDGKTLAVLTGFQARFHQPNRPSIVVLLDAATLAVRWRVEKPPPYAEELAFAPDGRTLAIAAPAEGAQAVNMFGPKASVIRLLNVENGAEVRRIPVEGFGVGSLAFAPDGRTLAAGAGDRTIRRYDPATGQERLPRLGRERAVAAVPEQEGNLRGLGARKGFDEGMAREAAALAFSPDGKLLASGPEDLGYYGDLIDVPPITIWDVATGRAIHRLAGHPRGITSLAFAPDGKTLASSGGENAARLWDVATGREVERRPGHPGEIHSMVISPADGSVFTSGNADGIVLRWDAASGRLIESIAWKPSMVDALGISPDGRTLFIADPGEGPVLWDLVGKKERLRLGPDRMKGARYGGPAFMADGRWISPRYQRVVFSPDGRTVAADHYIWDVVAGRLIVSLKSTADAVSFSADGRRIRTVDVEGVRTWDVTTGDAVGLPILIPGAGGGAAFSPDGRLVAISPLATFEPGRRPNTGEHLIDPIRVWELASGKEVATLFGHTDNSCAMTFSPDGRTLASVNGSFGLHADPGVRIWDVASGKPLRRFKSGPRGAHEVGYLPDGRSIVTAGDDGTAIVWDISDLAYRRASDPVAAGALEMLWSDLASDDAAKAHRASWELSHDSAVSYLRERLLPASAGEAAAGPEVLRSLRAIAALERIATPPAREVLDRLAKGDAGAPATQDARDALIRLDHRKAQSARRAAAK